MKFQMKFHPAFYTDRYMGNNEVGFYLNGGIGKW